MSSVEHTVKYQNANRRSVLADVQKRERKLCAVSALILLTSKHFYTQIAEWAFMHTPIVVTTVTV